MQLGFTKCHGSGNDFVMIGDARQPLLLKTGELVRLARTLCDRQSGINVGCGVNQLGADGLLTLQPDPQATAQVLMRMFNPDGSEAELCGNGLRCAARSAMQSHGVDELVVRTVSSSYRVKKDFEEHVAKVFNVTVDMGRAVFTPTKIPLVLSNDHHNSHEVIDCAIQSLPDEIKFSALAMPNPHFVVLLPAQRKASPALIEESQLKELGSTINNLLSVFPRGGNLNFVSRLADNEIFVRTFERGAGLTNACGSGMTAASIIAARLGMVELEQPVKVYNKGGYVITQTRRTSDGGYAVELTGNATFEASGLLNCQSDIKVEYPEIVEYSDEINAYAHVYASGLAMAKRCVRC